MGWIPSFSCANWIGIITCNSIGSRLCTCVESPKPPSSPPPEGQNTVVLAPGVAVHEDILRCTFVASGGPGGQNVNKRSTKAQLRVKIFDLGLPHKAQQRLERLARSVINSDNELVLQSDATRSQAQNKRACIDKLKQLVLRSIVEPKRRRATKPTRGSIERRIDAKKRRGMIKKNRKDPDQ
jgi:ribosome-associated protein